MSKKRLELEPANKIEVRIHKGKKLLFEDSDVIGFVQGEVAAFGNSAKINFTKEYENQKVYVVVCK